MKGVGPVLLSLPKLYIHVVTLKCPKMLIRVLSNIRSQCMEFFNFLWFCPRFSSRSSFEYSLIFFFPLCFIFYLFLREGLALFCYLLVFLHLIFLIPYIFLTKIFFILALVFPFHICLSACICSPSLLACSCPRPAYMLVMSEGGKWRGT